MEDPNKEVDIEKNVQEDVKKAVDEAAAEDSSPSKEEVSTPVVKAEEEASKDLDKDKEDLSEPRSNSPELKVDKMQEQINNLNIALQQEREKSKNKIDYEKVKELEEKLQESNLTIEKLRQVFSPEEPEEDEDVGPTYLTQEEFEKKWQEKEQQKKMEEENAKKASEFQQQISRLEKEWDGKDGKPKYDDAQVLKWQQDNNRLYLAPEEAFYQMHKNEIIDYEVKQRQTGARPVENVIQPSTSPGERNPSELKIETEEDTRSAVMEAMESAAKEM